ncbi:hypothetical protein GDO81_001816 [Engystomops pustulosus]|uniref:Ig-like domain-containing protein n=1 Tax=Engystomops pustulosus TaxID=76066 RepID=A0AAV7DGH7_ENGPU|nr:hypothetical protein GDO81_001816 [Engystomops pustulosus]
MTLYLVYCIVLYLSVVAAGEVLLQKDSEATLVGASIQLQCEAKGYQIDHHHLHWIRKSKERLVWIAGFRTGYDTYIADSFIGRVTPSTSGSMGLLNIDKLEYSDSGIYYCARQYGTMTKILLVLVQEETN